MRPSNRASRFRVSAYAVEARVFQDGAQGHRKRPWVPDAIAVGRLGAKLLASGAGFAADALTPVYVRRAEAEVQRTGERFEAPRAL